MAFGTGTMPREHMLRAGVQLDRLMILLSAVVILGDFVFL
ncbi:hypothetical protein H5V44_16065 [Halobellus sp. MBLA0160]|uniref:Uncharacterized protein n=1 Tax=Halobellus ruber TaxID=2761102 RepID=A0A7J9SNH2_9EURY|nr:hypothetical protein [Halobellus ruber]